MNINLQKILFGFSLCLLIVILVFNNSVFQKKILHKYLSSKQIQNNTYFAIENFKYNILSSNLVTDFYVIQKQPKIDTVFLFDNLQCKLNLLDVLFSRSLEIDFININNPDVLLSKNEIQNRFNQINSFFDLINNFHQNIHFSNLSISNLDLYLNNTDVIKDIDLNFKNLSIGSNFFQIDSILINKAATFFKMSSSLINDQIITRFHSSYIDSVFAKNKLLSDLAITGDLILARDSISIIGDVNYKEGQAHLSYLEYPDTTFYKIDATGVNLQKMDFMLDTLNLSFLSSGSIDFNTTFSKPSKDNSILISSTINNEFGTIQTSIELDTFLFSKNLIIDNAEFNVDFLDFQVGNYLNNNNLGPINTNLKFAYSSTKQKINNIKIKTHNLNFNNYLFQDILCNIQPISLNKPNDYKFNVIFNDKNLQARGDFLIKKNKHIISSGTIDFAALNNININVNDSLEFISADFEADFRSNFIELIKQDINKKNNQEIGSFKINNLQYFNEDTVSIDSTFFSFNSLGECKLKSSFGSATCQLQYNSYFKQSFFSESINFFLKNKSIDDLYISSLQLDFKNPRVISDIFLDDIDFSSQLKLAYNSSNHISSNLAYLKIELSEINFKDLKIIDLDYLADEHLNKIKLSIDQIYNNKVPLNSILFSAFLTDEKAGDYSFSCNYSKENYLDFKGSFSDVSKGFEFNFHNTSFVSVSNKKWLINPYSNISINSNGFIFEQLDFIKEDQAFTITGKIDKAPNLSFSFKEFNLDNINPFMPNPVMNFNGLLNGEIVFNPNTFPVLIGDFQVNDFNFNDHFLGNLTLNNYSNQYNDSLYTTGIISQEGNTIMNFLAKYPFDGSKNISANISLSNFPFQVLDRFIKPISGLSGQVKGDMHVYGPIKSYEIYGNCVVQDINFKVPYLNTNYLTMNDSLLVSFYNDTILLKSLPFYDIKYNTNATLKGVISHTALKDMDYDINISSDSLLVLNTEEYDNISYYGNVFLGGDLSVIGNPKNISINIDGVSKDGSKIMIPLSKSKEIRENKFIQFINPEDSVNDKVTINDPSKFNMNFNLSIDNSSQLQLIIDEEVGDMITGYGEGDLYLQLNKSGDFEMFGDFEIEKGNYLFTLQDVITKSFEIQRGGGIKFNGNPYDAEIDLNLLYNVQASLNPLNPEYDRDKKSPVICRMSMSGPLLKPDIEFYIDIPNSDQIIETSLETMTNTDQKLLEQFLYLLIANSFLIENDPTIDYLGNTLATTGTELLSNQLSNWLSQTTDAFDLGFKWIPGTGDSLSYQQVELAVSKKFLDDRVIINGNVGTPPEQTEANIVGDVDIEYDFFKDGRLKLKVFNRTRDYDPLSESLGYEQGFGIFFKKQFNSFKELFRKNESP